MDTIESGQTLRFGDFSVRPRARTLQKNGIRIKLYGQSFEILLVLLEHPGDAVTREELKKKLWPNDTFVDFEHSLNAAIRNLRRALHDSTATPRYIETLPRIGYRFVAEVRVFDEAAQPPRVSVTPVLPVPVREAVPDNIDASIPETPGEAPQAISGPEDNKHLSAVTRKWAIGSAIATALIVAVFLVRPVAPVPHVTGIRQITHLGNVVPNTKILQAESRIYFMTPGEIEYVSLDTGSISSVSKPFPNIELVDISPNGDELLVGRIEPQFPAPDFSRSMWRLPLKGGPPRPVGNIYFSDAALSPDGRTIVFAPQLEQTLNLVNIDGSNAHKIAEFPGSPFRPRWSPDGHFIRTSVAGQGGTISLWEVDSFGRNPIPLLSNWKNWGRAWAGDWTHDSRYYTFIFAESAEDTRNIWAMPEQKSFFTKGSGLPVQLTDGPLSFRLLRPSRDGKTIYAVGVQSRAQLMRFNIRTQEYEVFANGAPADQVSFSPDGQWIAYISYPNNVLVISRADGSDRLQLTFSPMRASAPRWSPDGSQLAFVGSFPGGNLSKLYSIPAKGGTPRLLAPGVASAQNNPDWLQDGKSVLFTAATGLSATPELHILYLETGKDAALPGTVGFSSSRISPDGRWIIAKTGSSESLILYDVVSHSTRRLAECGTDPSWSADGKYVNYALFYKGPFTTPNEKGFYRVSVSDNRAERIAPAPEFPLTGTGGFWSSLTPDGSPLVLRELGTSDIYALAVDTF
jgi:Tol biopolymer transport system component/DNA-binding winged helix-turn-helix (wHTH) protein